MRNKLFAVKHIIEAKEFILITDNSVTAFYTKNSNSSMIKEIAETVERVKEKFMEAKS